MPDMSIADIRTLLAKFGLRRPRRPPSAELSPGERTRAGMALFQARGVNVLVLDEPTNHLDRPPSNNSGVGPGLLRRHSLLVTHDRRMLDNVRTDRHWHVENGHVTERWDLVRATLLETDRRQVSLSTRRFTRGVSMTTVTPSTADRDGLSRSGSYRATRAGRWPLRTDPHGGVYASADSATDWEWLEAATRRPDATICLISALAHHDLTDAILAAPLISPISRCTHPRHRIGYHPGIPLTSQLSTSVVVKSRSVTTDLTIGLLSLSGRGRVPATR